jgi:hypothetical protein
MKIASEIEDSPPNSRSDIVTMGSSGTRRLVNELDRAICCGGDVVLVLVDRTRRNFANYHELELLRR